jgi:hypothetical protein
MKKLIALLSLIMIVGFSFAQQTGTTPATAQPAIKVMPTTAAQPNTVKPLIVTSTTPAPAPAQCNHSSAKACTKSGEAKAACCQQGGAQGCSGHGTTTGKKVEEKKAE